MTLERPTVMVKELEGMANVVARSPKMQTLLQQIALVAGTDATICLSGETGVGKEVIARVVHSNSRRAGGPFIGINCGAIPEGLFESELFGHVKGAFTGAQSSKRGLFQSAEGGTLFLDEIGEMPMSLQVKFLRAIQEREIMPVGAERAVKVDVRIITSTNKDLSASVRAGSFREDLYYRIQVVPLLVPPLRERPEDIPALAQQFLRQCAGRMHKDLRGFLPDTMHKLMLYSWPGNVRELENAIEKAAVLSNQDMIAPDLISTINEPVADQLKPLTDAKEEFERNYLKEVLQLTGGNVSRAAQIAGRYRADFYKLLKKHGLHPGDAKGELREEPDALSRAGISVAESAILHRVGQLGSCSFDELVRAFPDYNWNQVFTAVDRLSREGALSLRRPNRSDYVIEVTTSGRSPRFSSLLY